MDWELEFYQTENERVPVLELLQELSPKLRVKAFLEIELLERHGMTQGQQNTCKGTE